MVGFFGEQSARYDNYEMNICFFGLWSKMSQTQKLIDLMIAKKNNFKNRMNLLCVQLKLLLWNE